MEPLAPPPLRGLFVTGTDTGVGKTHVAALILRQLCAAGVRVGAYKPACSGAVRSPDGTWLWDDVERLSSVVSGDGARSENVRDRICPQRFLAPLAPPVAARLEGRTVDLQKLVDGIEVWRGRVEAVVIEGVGGWLCPVADDWTVADLAARWRAPVVIVARRGLGTINHTLLTIESIRGRNLPIAGVVLNEPCSTSDDPSVTHNATEIERCSGVPILGELLHGTTDELRRAGETVRIPWWELMGELSVVRGPLSVSEVGDLPTDY